MLPLLRSLKSSDGFNPVACRFMSSDSSVPEDIRSKYANDWGLCGDEFPETAHMSPQLYIREARRLVGEKVFTQNNALDKAPRGIESIGMGCCECVVVAELQGLMSLQLMACSCAYSQTISTLIARSGMHATPKPHHARTTRSPTWPSSAVATLATLAYTRCPSPYCCPSAQKRRTFSSRSVPLPHTWLMPLFVWSHNS